MEHNQNKYITYLRKSSESEDRQVQSIERQQDETARLIEIYSANVVESIVESRSAMMPNNRPGFSTMVKLIERGKANGIICWHINRLARNPYEWGVIHQLLVDKKLVSIITRDREFTSDDNLLIMSVEGGLSSQYSRDLGKSVKSGMEKKAKMGHPPFKARVGYLNTKSAVRGTNSIIIDPDRWPVIRKAFDMLLSMAYTVPQIYRVLKDDYNFRTQPANKHLSRSNLYSIFNDSFYYGCFMYNGQLYQGNYKAMITPEEYDRAQLILGRYGRPRPKHNIFNFTGFIRCGECTAAITATRKTKLIKSTGALKEYIFYHCTKRKANIPCNVVHYLHEWQLEEMIIQELAQYDIKECFKNWGKELLQEYNNAEAAQTEQLQIVQRQAEAKLNNEINSLLDMRIAGEISAEVYKNKRSEKEASLVKLQASYKNAIENSKQWYLDVENMLDFATAIVERFKNGDVKVKKEICQRFGWNWTLKDKKLFIDKAKWLEPAKKYKIAVEDIFGALEPEKTFTVLGQNASFDLLRPVMRAIVDDVGACKGNNADFNNTS